MNINADFTKPAIVHGADEPWVPSPIQGVDRRMLDRIGDEVARATSIVRYAPGSHFSPHIHAGGEEFLVLDGVFQDEYGDFPAGTYVRNPPQSRHTPRSDDGCTILVKLWQFDPDDRRHIVVDTTEDAAFSSDPGRPGVQVLPLFADTREDVRVELWDGNAEIRLSGHAGIEIFVLDGGFRREGERFAPWSWLRLPPGEDLAALVEAGSARVWIKWDHLEHPHTAPDVA